MKLSILILAIFSFGNFIISDAVMVCYYGSWAIYRPGHGEFDISHIDPFLCTHVVYSFVGLDYETWKVKILDPKNELCPPEGSRCALENFIKLKEINPNLKTLLAVGGWNQGSYWYSEMAAQPDRRKIFVESSVDLLLEYGFDGYDVDWEYPANRGGAPQDKENFVLLLEDLKAALQPHSMILTIAVSQNKPIIDAGYNMPRMAAAVDMVLAMTYDYHGSWNSFTHHNAPLYGHPNDQSTFLYLNVDYTIQYYINGGVPPEKLVLGIPTYGRCYTLANTDIHGFYAPISGPSQAGPFTMTPGTLGYNEICEISAATGHWYVVRDPLMHEPYTYEKINYKIWCGFDDPVSVRTKAEYAKEQGLLGAMVWSIETDDFRGLCGRKFDLINSIKEGLGIHITTGDPKTTTTTTTVVTTTTSESPTTTTTTTSESPTTTTTRESTTTTTPEIHTTSTLETTTLSTGVPTDHPDSTTPSHPTTTTPGGGTFECGEGVYYAQYPPDCTKYYICNNGVSFIQSCSEGLVFNPESGNCDWVDNTDVSGCLMPGETFPPSTETTPHTRDPVTTRFTDPGEITTAGGAVNCNGDTIYFLAAEKCNQYWQCNHGVAVLFSCPGELLWHQELIICDWPHNVDTSNCIL